MHSRPCAQKGIFETRPPWNNVSQATFPFPSAGFNLREKPEDAVTSRDFCVDRHLLRGHVRRPPQRVCLGHLDGRSTDAFGQGDQPTSQYLLGDGRPSHPDALLKMNA